ncbi:RecQ family ATP-dependent DNA helicase [Paenibacillus athensensis]|uniref:DNA 3'-5' helicase n=1 Tax=Paenibacillus athensensis TaxID=1967502 RepID=A0A4Y8Q3W5_9BACL|nr:RecQ family ATP-dependent DNA helicase [Paenibacillus athensensis]MCD1259238.1 RecQ family ATP-dependent DNA helicase [Paenibacillus athensensis]
MEPIAFIDTEIEPKTGRIADIGGLLESGRTFHSSSISDFVSFLRGSRFICGHNLLNHDLNYIRHAVQAAGIDSCRVIDTLHLSALLFPSKPYHRLVKDDKLQTEELNNPLNDAIQAKELFFDEITAFRKTPPALQLIFYSLLHDQKEFAAFFQYLGYAGQPVNPSEAIRREFHLRICDHVDLAHLIQHNPIELAYCLALIYAGHKTSITPPWIVKSFPAVQGTMYLLRGKPCYRACVYCEAQLDSRKGLKRLFGHDNYRSYAGQPLQEDAVNAAIAGKSLLAVFPTGGGKSITFQVPALMSGESVRGLTVVISPLQSLMKDQVDNLEKQGITEAVTVNGLLDPIERAKSLERVENGSASILYIAPESLRSKTIERLLLGRNVVRFVIDEAHCFSSWGQDFRVDYLYIGDFIKSLQDKKNLADGIPVSCFTATAKRKVIEDIQTYFRDKLSIEMSLFSSSATRTNLHYQVFERATDEEKYNTVRELLECKPCPTIVYVSRTKRADELAMRLSKDGYPAKSYHGKMEKHVKTSHQDAFMKGDVQIMVATSAFGMGVDKKDVGMVIHYDISDSLENYVQEAGRAGRDEAISADCYVLFNDEDLNRHFILLNQTKLSIQEIQQIWKAVKEVTRLRATVSQSALELARRAGWDDGILDIQTKVTTAVSALEEAGYLKRGQNMPRVYATSILAKNAMEAIEQIHRSGKFDEKQKTNASRIIRKLFSSKSRKHVSNEAAESRIDYIADHLAIPKEEVIQLITLMREIKVLADAKDLTAFIKKREHVNRSLGILKTYVHVERFLLAEVDMEEQILHIKELNEKAEHAGCQEASPAKLKTIFNIWAVKNWIKRRTVDFNKHHIAIQALYGQEQMKEKLEKRHELATFIVEYLYEKSNSESSDDDKPREEDLVEFSVLELKEAFESRQILFQVRIAAEEIEDALFYLSRIEALKIEGGFMVVYNALTIERIEQDNKRRYKVEDYQKLNQYYESKVQQIHIVGEYAKQMIADYQAALQFVEDYFQLNYSSFLNKYFKGSRQNEIKRNITPAKFRQLFGELSPVQLKIINDNASKHMVVAAGPGSGKTRILVHKLASLLLIEDVKHEQLLMLTFSRAAATEFKMRLQRLIGNAAHFIEIKTFHSYCFDLLGKMGTIEKSDEIIKETLKRIESGEVEAARLTKTVLVIDEAQDMNTQEYALVSLLMEMNEEMRVIAVGDDDQNVYEFRGSSAKHMKSLSGHPLAVKYELLENYRSKRNLVDFANQFAGTITDRLKETPAIAVQGDSGQIKLIRHSGGNLIAPLVESILAGELRGTTCVLTRTNDDASLLAGLLVKHGMQAKLIQSNDGFNLYNLSEVRFFVEQLHLTEDMYTIGEEDWRAAERALVQKHKRSPNVEIVLNLLRDFEQANPRNKYKSDLDIFIRESRLEDFIRGNTDTIIVSTIHKAKGREFDHVFLMLDQFSLRTDEEKRQVYVAITRAKSSLTIHCSGPVFDFIQTDGLLAQKDDRIRLRPDKLVIQLMLQDVWLDFFLSCQEAVKQLNSGDQLAVDGECCRNAKGVAIIRFSKQMKGKIERLRRDRYQPMSARIKYIVYWYKEAQDKEILIALPELHVERAVLTQLPNT